MSAMILSPTDRAEVLDLAAEKLASAIRAEFDLAALITVPVSTVSQITGLSRSQVERTFALRAMGKRKHGVSLRLLQDFLK